MITPEKTNVGFEHETPREVMRDIKNIIKDKTFYDLGCRAGKFMQLCARHASEVRGMEMSEGYAEIGINEELDITVGDILIEDFPNADVYYIWIPTPIMFALVKRIFVENYSGTYIFGHYPGIDYFFEILGTDSSVINIEKRTVKTSRGDFELHILVRNE